MSTPRPDGAAAGSLHETPGRSSVPPARALRGDSRCAVALRTVSADAQVHVGAATSMRIRVATQRHTWGQR
jgi:hypothetical protein